MKTSNLIKKIRQVFLRNFSCQYLSGRHYAGAAFKWSPYTETLEELLLDAQTCESDSSFKLGIMDIVSELRDSEVELMSRADILNHRGSDNIRKSIISIRAHSE